MIFASDTMTRRPVGWNSLFMIKKIWTIKELRLRRVWNLFIIKDCSANWGDKLNYLNDCLELIKIRNGSCNFCTRIIGYTSLNLNYKLIGFHMGSFINYVKSENDFLTSPFLFSQNFLKEKFFPKEFHKTFDLPPFLL